MVVRFETPGMVGGATSLKMLGRQFTCRGSLIVTGIDIVAEVVANATANDNTRVQFVNHLVKPESLRLGEQPITIKPN